MEAEANKTRRPATQFRVGDKVWLDLRNIKSPQTSKKLAWTHAKFTVTAVPFSHTVKLEVPSGIHPRFHVELLQHAHENPLPSQQRDDAQPGPAILADDEEDKEWEIEKILRVEQSTWHGVRLHWALVKWTGYIEPTWEPLDEVQHSDAFGQFVAQFGPPGDVGIGEPNQQRLGPRNRSVAAQYAKRVRKTTTTAMACATAMACTKPHSTPLGGGGGNAMGSEPTMITWADAHARAETHTIEGGVHVTRR